MKKYLFFALLGIGLLGCSKYSPTTDDGKKSSLQEVKSYYQTYSFGNLNSSKSDWEYWRYNSNGLLEYSKTYNDYYDFKSSTGLPKEIFFQYNSDNLVKEVKESRLSSTVYKYFYTGKQLAKKETWLSSGLYETENYSYKNGLISEAVGNYIIEYKYDSNNNLISEEYFKNGNRTPWHKYTYEYDSRNNQTKKVYIDLEKNKQTLYNSTFYEYNDKGFVSKKTSGEGLYDKGYMVTYQYNDKGQISSEQVKSKSILTSNYDDLIYISYEYIYK